MGRLSSRPRIAYSAGSLICMVIYRSFLVILLLVLFVFTDIPADIAFIVHFVTAPNHFTYHGHSDYVSAVAWSPDGKRIASASGDHTVQVWDAVNGSHVLTYRGHSSDVATVAWSSDSQFIASGGLDTTVQVWQAATGNLVYTYHGHSDAVFDVAWSPDGTRIASASNDGSVQLWDAFTGSHVVAYRSLTLIRGGASPRHALPSPPEGKRAASGGSGDLLGRRA